MDKKDHFVSTAWDRLNWGDGHDPFLAFTGCAGVFGRGGLTVVYVPDDDDEFPTYFFDLDVCREYYISHADESQVEWWSLEENPHVLLDALALPTYDPDDGFYVTEEALRNFIDRWGQLTKGFLRDGEDPEKEMYWNLTDSRNMNFVCQFSFAVSRLRSAARLPVGDPETTPELLLLIDESPAGSLYRALLLQLLQRSLSGLGGPKECAGCGRWFFETADPSTAVHRPGWKRRDAKYHSKACMKAAAERRRRARLRAGQQPSASARAKAA